MNARIPPLALAALLGSGWTAAGAQNGAFADTTVVARVGSAVVTRKDLLGHLHRYYGKAALEQLVDRSVLAQEAARLKVEVTDAELNERFAAVKKESGLQFAIALQNEGISEDAFRARLRTILLAEKVRDRKWPVTDEDLVRLSGKYARLTTERLAKEVIREAQNRVSFDLLVNQRSLDRENGGVVAPDPFLRVENPWFFRAFTNANLRPGQVTPQPVQSGEFWLVLKLERRLEADTLKGAERERAIAKVKAYRGNALLSSARKLYKIEYPNPPAATGEPGTELAKITPLRGTGTGEAVTRKELNAYLLEYVGRAALRQLTERAILDQEAAKLNLSVPDAQLTARAATLQRALGPTTFQARLAGEGITEEAWRDRLRYELLAEHVLTAKFPAKPEDLERLTARFVKVQSRREAEQVIQAAQAGTDFGQLIRQRSLDQRDQGFVSPRQFLRSDSPTFFEAIKKAGVMPGQVVPQPVPVGSGFFVLRLEQRLGPETLSQKERDEVTRRVNLPKASVLLEENRKGYKIEYPVPLQELIADAKK